MKYSYSLFLFAFLSLFLSCSGDDDATPESKNYLPIAEDNAWVYGYSITTNQSTTHDSDTTRILENYSFDGIQYREWSPVFFLFGLSNSMFVRKNGDKTYFKNPNLDLGFDETYIVPPFIMIDDDSSAATVLDTFESEQEFAPIPIPDTLGLSGSITPKVFVKATSEHVNSFAQTNLNGEAYEDVYENNSVFRIQVDLIANLTASGANFSFTHTWIPEQNYGVLKSWYANDIGLARSEMSVGIEEVDNTVDVPIIGEVDLESFGISLDSYLSITNARSVAELDSYELN